MAAKIKSKLGETAEVVPGSVGAYEVVRDGKVVFSQLKLGRFPDNDDEVLKALGQG